MRAVYDVVARFRGTEYKDADHTVAIEAADIQEAATKAQRWLHDHYAEHGTVPTGWRIVRIEEVRQLLEVE